MKRMLDLDGGCFAGQAWHFKDGEMAVLALSIILRGWFSGNESIREALPAPPPRAVMECFHPEAWECLTFFWAKKA